MPTSKNTTPVAAPVTSSSAATSAATIPAPPALPVSSTTAGDPNVALLAYVQQTVATLDSVEAALGADPPLTLTAKRHAVKMRKGGTPLVGTIGNLATQNQLEVAAMPVASMTALVGKAQALQPLADRLAEFVKHVGDLIFSAQSEAWDTALQYYALLQRRAQTDAELATSLQPVTQFLAYRHPSTKPAVGAPTKKQVNAAKKAQRTLATVAGGKLANVDLIDAGKDSSSAPAPAPATSNGAPPVTNGGSTPAAH